jgi:hypothetical protein
MECGHEAEAKESSRRGAWQAGWAGAQRGQAPRQPRKWPQGRSGQKPQTTTCRPSQCTAPSPRPPQEIIEVMIASIRARFGAGAIGLGHQGIRFAEDYGRGVHDAHTA